MESLKKLQLKFPKKEDICNRSKKEIDFAKQLKNIKKDILEYGIPITYKTRMPILDETIEFLHNSGYETELIIKLIKDYYIARHGFEKSRDVKEYHLSIK